MNVAALIVAAVATLAEAPVEARVTVDRLEVFDKARMEGYIVATLRRGDRLRVRPSESPRPGWLAIDPPGSVFCWVEASALRFDETEPPPITARVRSTTVVRSANLKARLPGPPQGELHPGDLVSLMDLPVLEAGDKAPKRWQAIAPPARRAFYVRGDGVDWSTDFPPTDAIPTAFVGPDDDPELRRIDAMMLAETTGQPVEKWRLETIREAYQKLAAEAGGDADRARTVERRLTQLEGYERAAKAARGFVEVATRSRGLDDEFSRIERKLAAAERERLRAFDAVGFIQPSVKMLDGRKLFALIGREGTVAAYLDVPPGINPEPLTARRVGVRGASRYNSELKARLIAVRDVVNLEPSRSDR